MAARSIGSGTNDEFRPETYHDAHRGRVPALVDQKIAGPEVAEPAASLAPRAQVIDLMHALQESLAPGRTPKSGAGEGERAVKTAHTRRPAAAARAAASDAPPKRTRKKSG